jgi:hypothetical protein
MNRGQTMPKTMNIMPEAMSVMARGILAAAGFPS